MPRLSLYRSDHTNDYKWQDRRISELYTVGGVGINIHKYLGPKDVGATTDITQPQYANQSEKNIQDLLFLENRDRSYDTSIYELRGHYTIQDIDYNLSQFGLFQNQDTLYITFHTNDMIARIGRKIIPGDVFEMPHLRDYYPLDETLPAALKKFYVVQEATRASEGYAQTWWNHIWRCKVAPMVDGQEYRDILDMNAADGSKSDIKTNDTIRDLLSAYTRNNQINDAVVSQADSDVPQSGYSTNALYILPAVDGVSPIVSIPGYLTGSATPPNGLPVTADVQFPLNPTLGQYVLRTDYLPNRLFRYDGQKWVAIQDVQRTALTGNLNATQLGSFINNNKTTLLANGAVIPQKQTLSNLLQILPDKLG
jgi:hypothetical protein